MNNIFSFVIKNKIYVFALFAAISLWSLLSLNKLQIDAVPDISSTQVMVNTKTAALSTEQIEKIVTYPIEMELSGLQNIRELRSLSKYGLSQVIAVFEDGTDLYFARQLVTERLQNAKSQIPDGLSPELAPVSTGLGEIFMWTLALKPDSEKLNLTNKEQLQYLKRIQEYVVRPSMKQVPGVAEIDTNGGFSSEVHINFTPEKLRQYGLSTNDILRVTSSLGVSFSGGYIQKDGHHITIAANTDTKSLDDIRKFVIKIFPNGKALTLGDVCRVEIDSALRVGAATSDGQETVLGTVLMRIGENSRQVAADAKKTFTSLDLPKDVVGTIVYNREFLVNATIHTVEKNLLEGAGLVILVLFLILGNFRAAALVSLAIPVS
ncbi:MAG: efflux RND transporter permease subunit, partial [Bdellovibrionaceae bacterium]|nr:efflux RND transporter permease subunit [Pseudobdellovibrionaceae bacterium]